MSWRTDLKERARRARAEEVPEYGDDKKNLCFPVSEAVANALQDDGIQAERTGSHGHQWVAVNGRDVGAPFDTIIVDATAKQFDDSLPDVRIITPEDSDYQRYMEITSASWL